MKKYEILITIKHYNKLYVQVYSDVDENSKYYIKKGIEDLLNNKEGLSLTPSYIRDLDTGKITKINKDDSRETSVYFPYDVIKNKTIIIQVNES